MGTFSARKFGDVEFRRLERWIGRIRDWSACDGLCIGLRGPLVEADSRRLVRVFSWIAPSRPKSKRHWYRRAAAVSLVPAARRGLYTREIFWLSDRILTEEHHLVQKAVGRLLKETSKVKPKEVSDYLMRVRDHIPSLTLRTALEKLPEHPLRRRRAGGLAAGLAPGRATTPVADRLPTPGASSTC